MHRLSKFGHPISDGIVFVFHLSQCVRGFKSLKQPVLEINFWVWSSIGPVGLQLTAPSAKLLITHHFYITLDACYLCLQVNA